VLADEVDYTLLAPIPITNISGPADSQVKATQYIIGIVNLTIAIAGVLAVLKIIFAGIKYMSTDAWQAKQDGKNDIKNAIWGLMLAISAWLILYTINPQLIIINLSLPTIEHTPSPSPSGG